MTKDIILTISGLHQTDGEEAEPVEIIAPGQYFFKNGRHYVVYDEIMDGIDGTVKSTIKFTGEQVELFRSGQASTRMTFQENKEHHVIYQTPVGALSLSLYTKKITAELLEDCMDLEILYCLKAQGALVSESALHINVCPKELKTFS